MNPIADGTVSGLATALVWAGLALGYNHARNLMLRRRLKEAFKWQGRGRSTHGFTVSVQNRTAIPVIVRQVKIYESYPSSSTRLIYSHASNDVIDEPIGKIGDKQTEVTLLFPTRSEPSERGFVELPAHTGASWILPNKLVAQLDWTFAACRVVIEYTTVFGNRAVIPIFADEDCVRCMTRDYRTHREELLERLPEQPPQQQSA